MSDSYRFPLTKEQATCKTAASPAPGTIKVLTLYSALQALSLVLAVSGKWLITSTCARKRRRGFATVLVAGVLFEGLLFYSGMYVSAVGGVCLMAIDLRGFVHNGQHR